MRKRFLFIIINIFFLLEIFPESIGEYTLMHIPSGKLLNISDSPELFFNYIGESENLSDIPLTNNSSNMKTGIKKYSGANWEIYVQKTEAEIDDGHKNIMKFYGAPHPETEYNFFDISVTKDFKTIRGIGIGDDAKDVIIHYPNIKGYKSILEYFDENELRENCIKNLEKQFSDLKCLVLENNFLQIVRGKTYKLPCKYFLVFILDDKKTVSKIKMLIMVEGE